MSEPGLHGAFGFDLSIVEGNAQYLQFNTLSRMDYTTQRAYTFLVGSFNQGRQGENGGLFINKGFLHLRRTREVTGGFAFEWYAQKEFNEFILIEERNLFGLCLRYSFTGSEFNRSDPSKFQLVIGSGPMWEEEMLNSPGDKDTNLIRVSTYLVLGYRLDERVELNSTTYYQVNSSEITDYRLLMDGGISLNLEGGLSLTVKINLRYDSKPPAGLENLDFELMNGLNYSF